MEGGCTGGERGAAHAYARRKWMTRQNRRPDIWPPRWAGSGMRRWGTGTACNGFPRVVSLLARDGDAPRIFMRLGDRLAYSNGVVLLSIAAALVFVAFGGLTGTLIPLYAIGVFLALTLSQTGMVLHWWRLRNRHWRKSLCFNAVGGLLSAAVFITARRQQVHLGRVGGDHCNRPVPAGHHPDRTSL